MGAKSRGNFQVLKCMPSCQCLNCRKKSDQIYEFLKRVPLVRSNKKALKNFIAAAKKAGCKINPYWIKKLKLN